MLCDLQRRLGASLPDVEGRGGFGGPFRTPHAAAWRTLHRLCPSETAFDGAVRRWPELSVLAAGRVRDRGARCDLSGPPLRLREAPDPPLDRIPGRRRRGRL